MPRTAIRALTRQEAIPPTVEAPDRVKELARAYEAARTEARKAALEAPGSDDDWTGSALAERAGLALEDYLCRLALTEGRRWYRVGGWEYGVEKRSKRGFELARRSAAPMRA